MNRRVLVDTGYFVALLDPRDNLNTRAVELAKALAEDDARMVTTDGVVLEVANYFARGPLREHAASWIRALRHARGWEVLPIDRPQLGRAEERYARHGDKNWSLTDCHCMEVMHTQGIREVATPDAGFEQAGFRCLLR